MRRPSSEYADINGLHLYYEVHGEGQPIILLHGGVSASEVFGQVLPELAKTRKVLAVHLQGHGHTKDINRALRFEFMADDIAALLAYLKIPKADVLVIPWAVALHCRQSSGTLRLSIVWWSFQQP